MKAICVAGARPNFVKVKPVIDSLERVGAEVVFVHTGQHYDDAMSAQVAADLGLREPDYHLGVGSGTHAEQVARVLVAFEPVVEANRADVVVVVGDVNSTLACALVAAKAGVQLAHVEAGLRSRDWSMPEEINRVVTDRVSDYLFATSSEAADNLHSEGYRPDQIHLVGNVMIDSVLANRDRALQRSIRQDLGLQAGLYGLVTLHRPATVDDPAKFASVLGALERIASDLPLVFTVHPRTRAALEGQRVPHGMIVLDALGYLDFLSLEAQARLVLTDSGGVQEETTALGVACLTLRDETERPITVTEGTNRVVGRDPERIVAAARLALSTDATRRSPPLWDGHAADRIAQVLSRDVPSHRSRPTDLAPA